MKSLLATLALLAPLSGCKDLPTDTAAPASPAMASAAGPVTISRGADAFTYTGYTVDCSAELVAITAEQRYRYQVVQHPSGDWALSQHLETHIVGVGTVSGLRYTGSGVFNTVQTFAMPGSGAFQYVTSSHQVGITQGPADNSAFTVRAKWTIDATGKVAVDSFLVEWGCRG
jgi:hypothetical protein